MLAQMLHWMLTQTLPLMLNKVLAQMPNQMLAQMLSYKNSDAPCSLLQDCTHMALSLTASLLAPMPLTCIFCLQGKLLAPGTRSVTAQAGRACLTQQRQRGEAPAEPGEGWG